MRITAAGAAATHLGEGLGGGGLGTTTPGALGGLGGGGDCAGGATPHDVTSPAWRPAACCAVSA